MSIAFAIPRRTRRRRRTQLNSANRIDASFFGDPSKGLDGAQRPGALLGQTTSQYSSLSYGGHNQTVRYQGAISKRWLLEASYARALNAFNEFPDANTDQVTDRTVTPNVRTGGLESYEPGNRGVNNQYAVKSTNVMGSNELKYGFEYDRSAWTQLTSYTGPTFTAPNGETTATGAQIQIISDPTYGQIYRVVRASFNNGASTTQSYENAFVQDNWRVGNRLTVNPGLRWEQETAQRQRHLRFQAGEQPRRGSVRPSMRRATARRSCTATGAGSTRACRMTSPRARCRPRPTLRSAITSISV